MKGNELDEILGVVIVRSNITCASSLRLSIIKAPLNNDTETSTHLAVVISTANVIKIEAGECFKREEEKYENCWATYIN